MSVLDPELEALRGAFPYGTRPVELPDDDPVPSLRLSRRRSEAGLVVALDHYIGAECTKSDCLRIERLPVNDLTARPRPRRWPAPPTVAALGVSAERPSWLPAAVAVTELSIPQQLGPTDVDDLLRQASATRFVVLNEVPSDAAGGLAGLVLHLVAAGTPCLAPARVAEQLTLLSPALRERISAVTPAAADDDLELAALAADQRRVAWLDHDLRVTWAQGDGIAWGPRLTPRPLPSVSVVLVSRRPELVPVALAMLAEQRGVRAEAVIALHGGRGIDGAEAALTELGLAGHVMSVPGEVPYGATLNAAVASSSGACIVKWDDDDLYGPHHLEDLLVAQRQTDAELVGKAAEFVHLDEPGELLWRVPAGAESPNVWIAGGTLLLRRSTLDHVGGFPDIARAVDHHLKMRIREEGGTVFRTHGFGFVHRRHGRRHTWDAPEEQLRGKAVRSFPGVPEVVGLGQAARFVDLSRHW